MTIHRGPVRTLAGDREAAWPEAITGARCPRCGQFVGSVTVLMRDDPLGIGGDQIDIVSGICSTHGLVVATGWTPWP